MKSIVSTNAPAPIGPYSQAIVAGNLLFVSGQVAIVPATGNLNNPDIQTETTQVMENIKAILAAAGTDFSHVVKTTIFLQDMQDFVAVNTIYGSYLSQPFPARETVQVAGLPKNANVEISVTVLLG